MGPIMKGAKPSPPKRSRATNSRRQSRTKAGPDSLPQSGSADADATVRLRRILENPAFIRADDDAAFLRRDDLRHARLQLEYLKPELALQEREIRSTIVLFGGTRIVEPVVARQQVQELKAARQKQPGDTEIARKLGVAERILAKSRYYDVARDFARLVSESCKGDRPGEFVIVTGGGPGIMEAGNRGAYDAGRMSIGLAISLPHEQVPNSYITPELCFQFRYFALRKLHFVKRAKALVAFPGGYGTFDELFNALCLVQTRTTDPLPIVLVGEEFWRKAFSADFLAEEGVIDPKIPSSSALPRRRSRSGVTFSAGIRRLRLPGTPKGKGKP